MLTRIRIEVEGEDSAAATEEALTKYEHVIQVMEAQRCGKIRMGEHRGEWPADYSSKDPVPLDVRNEAQLSPTWLTPVAERGFYSEELARDVTDEVIEYDPSISSYKGRRVVRFKRTAKHSTPAHGALDSSLAENSKVAIVPR